VAEAATGADTLAALQAQAQERLLACARLIETGVRIVDPATTYIEAGVEVGPDTEIGPNTTLRGGTSIGRGCVIGPNAVIADSRVGDGCRVVASMLEGATLEGGADVGPFSHLRAGAHLGPDVHVGNFVEIKASRLGRGTKVGHFSYVGDAEVGEGVNIGAGTVTCNYDGDAKQRTVIGDGAFIGSDTMLVAPVTIGREARTGAGAVVTQDVPDGASVAGVPARALGGQTRRQVRQQSG
jgi:bifunctional UDP-N-acetylglucosamine pyrophosphorylase/glucosamine-1-phosphate N-acetyltransferase